MKREEYIQSPPFSFFPYSAFCILLCVPFISLLSRAAQTPPVFSSRSVSFGKWNGIVLVDVILKETLFRAARWELDASTGLQQRLTRLRNESRKRTRILKRARIGSSSCYLDRWL